LAGRWRGQSDGERRLTNVLHLAELLQAASSQIDGEQALIRWLAQQMDEVQSGSTSGGEEQTVRLESDEDLVKVITIHASKGLEYPVVCLPFAHSHRVVTADKAAVLQLEGRDGEGEGNRHWTLDFDKDDSKLADHDRLREDLRLWYVALTRARHALWVGWSAVKRGNGKTCVNHTCAAGHLLGSGQECEAADWLNKLQALLTDAQGQALSVHLQVALADVPLTLWQKPAHTNALREALNCTARIDKSWTIASFSRLTRDLSSQTLAPLVLHLNPPRPADDEPPEDTAMPTVLTTSPGAVSPWHGFAKGPTAGNFLHDQLEWLAADGFVIDASKAERLMYRCENVGYTAQADNLVQWLIRVVAQPLRGPNAPLNALGDMLPEMEFWLPAERLHARQVDALCQQHLLPGVSRPQLPDAQLHGMLMGFADLVFEHEGRYWVLDYKSNYLGADDAAYTEQTLDASMAQHRYEVQAALYMLALHRLLRARLGDAYDPAQQLGGAVYLFLRGIDGPAGGCCTLPAPLALLDGLDAMLNEEVAS
jgi:exodeoxyribonuclease V beta subunit